MRRTPILTALASAAILAGCGQGAEVASVATAPTGSSQRLQAGAPTAIAPTAAAAAGTTAQASTPTSPTAATTTPVDPASSPSGSAISSLRPSIHSWPIPFSATRKREMAAYSLRHYGEDTYVLRAPHVIVEHYTETATAQEAYNTFAPDIPDSEFHELPNTCAHFLVEQSGRIDELVSLDLRCRHTTGLNSTAIGIENVGLSDQAILADHVQLRASLRLTRWLRCRDAIALRNVIGHNESLSSPYHHDRVPAFQHQTHSDWNHTDMTRYRALLARLPCPEPVS